MQHDVMMTTLKGLKLYGMAQAADELHHFPDQVAIADPRPLGEQVAGALHRVAQADHGHRTGAPGGEGRGRR